MSLFTKKQTGDAGENYCAAYLKKNGYRILCRNYRKPYGEIDLVVKKRGVTAFVEVKTRRSGSAAEPCEAVDFRKQQRIIKAAQAYLAENETSDWCRFDVCEVIIDQSTLQCLHIRYLENAFEMR